MKIAEHGPDLASLQELVDSVPALIHTAHPDGAIDFFNQRWLEFVGLRLEDLEGWKWTAAVHPDDVGALVSKWRACLASGDPFELESRVRRADGAYRWMWHQKLPLRSSSGEIVKWYGSSVDIDDRKRADEKRTEAEFYLAEGQRLGHTGSWAFSAAGFDYWSPELFAIHGLAPGGRAPTIAEYTALVHPEDRGFVAQVIQKVLSDYRGFDFTKRIVRPDGDVRYVRCVGAPLIEGGRPPQTIVGTAIDVTEHELLTRELRRREAYLAEAQRLSRTGSFGWRPDSGEIVWSPETYRIFGYEEGIKPTLDSVVRRVHPEDRAEFHRVVDAASGSAAAQFEQTYRLLLPDESVKHVHALARRIADAFESHEFVGAVTDITEHKLAEEALRESEAALLEAQRLTHAGSWRHDLSLGTVTVTPEIHRILAISPDEDASTADSFFNRIHHEDRSAELDSYAKAQQTKRDFQSDYRIVRPDGSVRHLHNVGHPVLNESGEITAFIGTSADVTEQVEARTGLEQASAALRESEEKVRLIVDGIDAHVVANAPDGEVEFVNQRVLDYFGKTLEELKAWRTSDAIHPDDRSRAIAAWSTSIETGQPYDTDYRIRRSDGVYRWFHTRARALRGADGAIVCWYTLLTDIDERKHAEQRLKEQEAELRQMLDLTPQLVSVYGPNRERLYANQVMLDYVGLSLEEWRRRSKFGEALHPDDWERATGHFDRAVFSGAGFELELRLRKGDGGYRWFLVRCNPVRDDEDQIVRWYVAGTDIDDRKRAEERLQQENVALREEVDKASMFEEIVGASSALKALLSRVSKVAGSDSTVLITGETGTGKELVARAIHRRSRRASRAFVAVNCAAIPRDLIASELFGHEKGAFTGAVQRQLGRFELADGGTMFLDEVGELSSDTQVMLLRVLQEREFERVGGRQTLHVDVRVITATNRDLTEAVAGGTFRQDLFYRLNVFPLEMPPLRERREDIPVLVEYFIHRYARKAGKTIRRVSKRTLDRLQSYPWPGNVRELQNVIERSVIVCDTDEFTVDDSWLSAGPAVESRLALSSTVAAHEKATIEEALRASGGRVFGPSGAAARLGIARSTLESKIRALGINKNRFRGRPLKE